MLHILLVVYLQLIYNYKLGKSYVKMRESTIPMFPYTCRTCESETHNGVG